MLKLRRSKAFRHLAALLLSAILAAPPFAKAAPIVSVSATQEGGHFHYNYSITNTDSDSKISYALMVHGAVSDVSSPPGWRSDAARFLGDTSIIWISTNTPNSDIAPGAALDGFAFNSSGSASNAAASYAIGSVSFTNSDGLALGPTSPSYSLTVSTGGGGTVNLNPPGGRYPAGATVTLSATPLTNWSFLYWQGSGAGLGVSDDPTTSVVISDNESIQAVFGTSVLIASAGGRVLLQPAGGVYPYGSVVRATAIPDPGSYFSRWTGNASGTTNPFLFTVSAPNPTLTPLFFVLPTNQVALTVQIVGQGKVTRNPEGNVFTLGQNVTLSAIPDPSQEFLHWSGDTNGTQNPLVLTADGSKQITANFSAKPSLNVTGNVSPDLTNGFHFTLTGYQGTIYDIQTSTNLLNWDGLETVRIIGGLADIFDASPSNSPARFYRAKQ